MISKFVILFMVVAGVASLGENQGKGKLISRMLQPKGHVRSKRSLYEFYLMIKCETDRSPSDYNGYGCWCGKGGKGEIVDDLDRCCYVHDHCYKMARESGKCPWPGQIYWDGYHRLKDSCSDCDGEKNSECEQALCECDRDAARCFAANRWDKQYDNHSKDKC